MSTQIFPEHPIKQRFTKSNFKKTFSEYYPLLSILIGFVIVAIFLGPYNNGDTAWEYEAATGVLEYGLPYANGAYLIINLLLVFISKLYSSKFLDFHSKKEHYWLCFLD